jgi:alkane 1-monooxygenase
MAGYPTRMPTRLAPSGTVPDGTTELWKDRKRYPG